MENQIITGISDVHLVAWVAFILSSVFITMTYVIHKKSNQYFDIVSGVALVLFLSISGFLNGFAWINMGTVETAFIWLLIGLGIEMAKPILIRGSRTISVKIIILMLQLVSIASATAVIHGTLQSNTDKYIEHQSKMNSTFDTSKQDALQVQIDNIILSNELATMGMADINKKLSHYQALQAWPTAKQKKDGAKGLLSESIFELTKSCTLTSSPYYVQRNACSNIMWYQTEKDSRIKKASLTTKLNVQVELEKKSRGELYKEKVDQNAWMSIANRLVSLFYDDFIFVAKTDKELIQLKEQSQISSMVIALTMGILIEMILHIISFKTFNYPKRVVEFTVWSILKHMFIEKFAPKMFKDGNKMEDETLIYEPANLVVDTVEVEKVDLKIDPIPKQKKVPKTYTMSKTPIELEKVLGNLKRDVLLTIYERTQDEAFDKETGRYAELAIYLIHNHYIELGKVPSQHKLLTLYKEDTQKSVQFPEISAAMKLIKPIFTERKGRSYNWISKSDLKEKFVSIGLNVV